MDTGHVKFQLPDDLETQAIDKRRELLAAYRLVLKNVEGLIASRNWDGADNEDLRVVLRHAAWQVEHLEQAE